MSATNARLSPGAARDYAELLEQLSDLVLEFLAKGNVAGVRRWASSLAHVGFVLLDNGKVASGERRVASENPRSRNSSLVTRHSI